MKNKKNIPNLIKVSVVFVLAIIQRFRGCRVFYMEGAKSRNRESRDLQKRKKKVLLTYHSCEYKSTYHPLKRRRIKTEKIKYAFDIPVKIASRRLGVLSRKYFADVANSNIEFEDITGCEYVMFDWLKSVGIVVEEVQPNLYSMDGRLCSFGYIFIFANKLRISMHLKPFFKKFD